MMNIKAIKQKLYLDHHHRMEFFGIAFLVFIFVMVMLIVISVRININNGIYKGSDHAIVTTTKMPWSKTGTQMAVTGVYRNAANTKAVVWLKMDDMKMMSTDPNTYSVFINAYRDMRLDHPLTGSLYMFGDTGNMALLVNDFMGFEDATIEVIMRSKPIYEDPGFDNPYTDVTFINNNQVLFMVNLGADDATIVDYLDEDTIDPRDMYYSGALTYPIEVAQENINNELIKLKDDISKCNAYKQRLIDYGFMVPTMPQVIVSDFISADAVDITNKPIVFDESMFELDSAIITSEHGAIMDNEVVSDTVKDSERYYYISDFVYPGGINVNINDASYLEKILNTIKPAQLTYAEWRSEKALEASKYPNLASYAKPTEWQIDSRLYTYGSNATYDTAIDNYNTAIAKLMEDKKEYQTESIYEVFDYVSELDTIADGVRVNSNGSLITQWVKYR